MVELPLDTGDIGAAVSGGFQFVSDVRISAHQAGRRLVERGALRFTLLQVLGNFSVAAKVMDMLQLAFWGLNGFAEQRDAFERVVQTLAALLETIL